MWPVGTIVATAIALGTIVLAATVAFAITIDRRRYRERTNRQSQYVPEDRQLDILTNGPGSNLDNPKQRNLRGKFASGCDKTWFKVRPSATYAAAVTPRLGTAKPEQQCKSLSKTLHGPVKKKGHSCRKPKPMSSTRMIRDYSLFTIAEQSSLARWSLDAKLPQPMDLGRPSLRSFSDNSAILLRQHAIAKSRIEENAYLNRTRSVSCTLARKAGFTGRPVSMKSSVFKLPASVPRCSSHSVASKDDKLCIPPNGSSANSKSVNNVISDLTEPQSIDIPLPARETDLHLLQAADFSPDSITIEGPSNQQAEGCSFGYQVKALDASQANLPPNEILKKLPTDVRSSKMLSTLNLAEERIANQSRAVTGRHSMFEPNTTPITSDKLAAPHVHGNEDDPFLVSMPLRPISADFRKPLREINNKGFAYYGMGGSTRRQSQSPTRPMGVSRASMPFRNLHDHNQDVENQYLETTMLFTVRGRPATGNGVPADGNHDLHDSSVRAKCRQSDIKFQRRCLPNTPDSIRNPVWAFDTIQLESPKIVPPQSPLKHYDSPILPSPALKPARLHPRRSLVSGPHNQQNQSQSPLRPKPKLEATANADNTMTLGLKSNTGSTDLRRSIAILRSMNCGKSFYKSDSTSNENSNSAHVETQDNDIVSSAASTVALGSYCQEEIIRDLESNYLDCAQIPSSTSTPIRPCRMDMCPTSDTLGSLQSLAEASMWEDISVHDDTLEPDPPSTFTKDASVSAVTDPVQPDPCSTCDAQGCDDHTFLRQKLKRNTPSWIGISDRKQARPMPGGNRLSVPDTPRSLYDATGFLKN